MKVAVLYNEDEIAEVGQARHALEADRKRAPQHLPAHDEPSEGLQTAAIGSLRESFGGPQ